MTIQIKNIANEETLIYLKVTGKLTTQDYQHVVSMAEPKIKEFGAISILVELNDFHGWSAGALWEDAKFSMRHFSDIEKIAIVGDQSWEKGMANFIKPFTKAKVRYFDANEKGDQIKEAKIWVSESLAQKVA